MQIANQNKPTKSQNNSNLQKNNQKSRASKNKFHGKASAQGEEFDQAQQMLGHKQNDTIYPKQFILLFIMSSVTFKITMLPQYLCEVAGRNAYLAMGYMLFIEVLMIGVVYGVISRGSLLELNIPKWIKGGFIALIIVSNLVKSSFIISGITTYVSVTLFEKSTLVYVLIALLPVVMYMAYKGINVISRVCQISFWFIVATFLYMFMFAQVDGFLTNLLPIEFSTDVFVACDKHLFWFADYTPLLLASLVKTSKSSKGTTVTGLGFMVVCPLLLMIVFISNFGGGTTFVPNAFGKLAIYNRISTMLGTVDFATVCTWIIMAILKISIIVFATVRGCKYFFGDKWWISVIIAAVIFAIVYFWIRDLRTAYELSTGWLRYFVAIIEFGLPMAIYICMRVFDPERKQKLSTDQKRSQKNQQVQQQESAKDEEESKGTATATQPSGALQKENVLMQKESKGTTETPPSGALQKENGIEKNKKDVA